MSLKPLITNIRINGIKYFAAAFISLFVSFSFSLLTHLKADIKTDITDSSKQVNWTVFLKDGQPYKPIKKAIEGYIGVKNVIYVSKDKALDMLLKNKVIEGGVILTGRNPFPESLEVSFCGDYLDSELISNLTKAISSMKGIQKIVYQVGKIKMIDKLKKRLFLIDIIINLTYTLSILVLILFLGRFLFYPKTLSSQFNALVVLTISAVFGIIGPAVSMLFIQDYLLKPVIYGICLGLSAEAFQRTYR